MIIGISNDHAATNLKFAVLEHLTKQGHKVINYGTDSLDSYDYPVAAKDLCQGILKGEVEVGIAICGTGVGISIACNKHKGIRACCCSEVNSARFTKDHNNANVICFGSRIVDEKTAFDIVDTFLNTPFSNGERHIHRIDLIKQIEDEQ